MRTRFYAAAEFVEQVRGELLWTAPAARRSSTAREKGYHAHCCRPSREALQTSISRHF